MTCDAVNIKGTVTLEFGSNGIIKETHVIRNLVTDIGKNYFAQRILGDIPNIRIDSIGVGSGVTPATPLDEALAAQTSILPIDSSQVENNILTFFVPFPEGVATGDIQEVGLFDANNRLLCRTVFASPFNKTFSQFLNVSWQLQIG